MERESSIRTKAKLLPARRCRLFVAVLAISLIVAFANAANALALSPSVSTLAAANVADTTATLNGSVNPNGLETKTYFEYGPTTSYGSKTSEVSVGSGSSTIEKSQAVSGLSANTTYHYRIVATNSSGTSQGTDRTFTVGWVVQTPVSLGKEITGNFQDVSCSSATACTAVGSTEEQAVVERWNGTEWISQTPAKPSEAVKTAFEGVSCPSSSTCYAVGRYTKAAGKWLTLIEFWNGSEWKVQTSPNPEGTQFFLEDVSCSSESECTAVGWYQNIGPPETSKTLALRWNGSKWSIQESKNPTSNVIQLRSVSCASSTFCMAAGYYYYESKFVYTPLSERWDGTNWTIEEAKPVEGKMNWLYGVSCTSSTACTAVGAEEVEPIEHETKTMARRWNGTAWSTQTMPSTGSSSLEDVSCTSSMACTAVGNAGTPIEMRWNGSAWTLFAMPLPSGGNTVRPFAVSCVAARGCEAVGMYRLVGPTVYPLAEGRWRSAPPTATTTAATSIGEKTATLNGTVNPNGSETKAFFEYGTTTSYGSKTAEVNIGSGTSSVEQNVGLTGLSPATTYHYRIVGNNENPETGRGSDQTFRTTAPPTVVTLEAEVNKSGEAATLQGQVNPNGLSTTYQFEYGTSPGKYTNTVPAVPESAGAGTESKTVSYEVTGLSSGKTYYYRITASNSAGTSNGGEVAFSTSFLTPTETIICKKQADPCPAGKDLGVGETFELSESGTAISETTGGTLLDTCTGITVKGTVQTTTTPEIAVPGSGLVWTGCTKTTDTIEGGTLQIHRIPGTYKATVTIKGFTWTALTIFGTCTFGWGGEFVDLGELTETGEPPLIHVNAIVPRKSGICPNESRLTADFALTAPTPATVLG